MNRSEFLGIKLIDLSDDTTVSAAGGTDTQTLQPPKGQIYQIIQFDIEIPDPVGSTANNHKFNVKYQNMTDGDITFCNSNTGSDIKWNAYGWIGTTEVPGSDNEQFDLIHGGQIWASYDQPVDFVYVNLTDADQTGTRRLEIMVKVWKDAF